jgi:hypothetical protein
MTDTIVQIIFGWPAIIATLLVSTAGLVWKRYWLMLVGALLFFPFSLYLSGLPVTRGLGLFLPVFQLGAALAIRARKFPLAWVLVSPVFIISAWLAYQVVTQ